MCFDRNINGNRNVRFLGCDYLLVQQCVKLTLVDLGDLSVVRRILNFVFNIFHFINRFLSVNNVSANPSSNSDVLFTTDKLYFF